MKNFIAIIQIITFIVWLIACANYLDKGNIWALYATIHIPLAFLIGFAIGRKNFNFFELFSVIFSVLIIFYTNTLSFYAVFGFISGYFFASTFENVFF